MRGNIGKSGNLFSDIGLDDSIPKKFPSRLIRAIVNDVLIDFSMDFSSVYSDMGQPSIAPEKLLRARHVTPHIAA